MKRTIRIGMFETNSSNTHSMIICSEEEYAKLKNEELFVERWGDTITDKTPVDDEDGYIDFIVVKSESSAWSEDAVEVTAEEC